MKQTKNLGKFSKVVAVKQDLRLGQETVGQKIEFFMWALGKKERK